MSVTPSSSAIAASIGWRAALAERYDQVRAGSVAQAARWQFSGLRLAQDGAC